MNWFIFIYMHLENLSNKNIMNQLIFRCLAIKIWMG